MTSKEKVLSVYSDADAYRNRFLAKWLIYRDSNPDVNIGEGVCLSEAWDDAASMLPSAPSPAGETASEPSEAQLKDAFMHQDELCSCSHARGDHWHRVQGVMECGKQGCRCAKFAVPEPVSTEGVAEVEAKFDPAFLVLVPRAPTPKMMTAAWTTAMKGEVSGVWAAMIAAWDAQIQESVDLYERLQPSPPVAAPIAPAAVETRGNETKPVADLLNSMKVIDRSQRYIECRADLLTQYMYELVSLRAQPSAEGDGWIEFVSSLLPELDAAERLAQKIDRVHGLKLAFAIRKVSDRFIERAELSGQGEVK